MNTNVNLAAQLGVVALLGTGLVLGVIGILLIYSIAVRRFDRARLAAVALMVVGGLYLGAILIFAFTSNERILTRGAEKHFCEIDCHLAYSVIESKQTKTIDNTPSIVTAGGMFSVVTIKTRFDETTMGSNRGNGALYPNSRLLTVIDDQGRKYAPSLDAQRALETSGTAGTSLVTPLRPGESYTTTVVFDLPVDARNPTLLINEGEWVTHVVIGHENSPLHKKTKFQI